MFYIRFLKFFIEKWANRSFSLISSFLMSDVSDSLTITHFLWAMWANCSGRSSKMSDVRESLLSLTKNERPWAIRSHRSEKMSDCEQIALVAHQKWANEWIALFLSESLKRPFLGKKRAIRLENRWANFQPCRKWVNCSKTNERVPNPAFPAL